MDDYCPRCGFDEVDDLQLCTMCIDGEADDARTRFLLASLATSRSAQRILAATSDPRAVSALLETLGKHDSSIVLQALGRSGSATEIQRISEYLSDSDQAVRNTAVIALIRIGGAVALDILAETLSTSTEAVEAACGLAWHGDARCLEILINNLHAPHRNSNWSTLAALIRLGDARAIPPMIAELERLTTGGDVDPQTASRTKRLALALLQLSNDESGATTSTAIKALGGPQMVPVAKSRPFSHIAPILPGSSVQRWSLELEAPSRPIDVPVTKFGGQPNWIAAPTWPEAPSGALLTFFAQFQIPADSGAMAYLFIDVNGDESYDPSSGEAVLVVQPNSGTETSSVATATGPSYPSEVEFPELYKGNRRRNPRLERRARLEPGFEPTAWSESDPGLDDREWNKVGGTPRFLEGEEQLEDEGWNFLFQFSAEYIGFELGDGAECYGYYSQDGRGLFFWQCH